MPAPRWLAKANRAGFNRIVRHIAPWAPGFGVVIHRGRRSGRTYRTPVNVFRRRGGFVIALTYGRDSDWVKNVLAAGGCELETRRRRHQLSEPRLYRDERRRDMPAPVRLALGAISADEFVALDVAHPERSAATMKDMQTWDAITSRRNVREYDDRPIADQDLDRILEAGRRAPSSRNWQPWDFIVVSDRQQLQELSKVWQFARHVAGSAATVALIAPEPASDTERDWIQYDLGQATMSMMIAATGLGIGTGHASVVDQQLARDVLRLPPDRFCAYLIALGYPRKPLRPITRPNRRPFEDVVHRGHW